MKIYTKTGDRGTTSLIGGQRTSKDDLRVEAYGTVDELSAHIALLRDGMRSRTFELGEYCDDLHNVLNKLMTVGALLALDSSSEKMIEDISTKTIKKLEDRIDTISSQLTNVNKFTIPGGDILISQSHVCRTVCRRAERRSVSAAREYQISTNAITYLNRLSDYLYILGRKLSDVLNIKEELWTP